MTQEQNQQEIILALKDIASSLRLMLQPIINESLSHIFSSNIEIRAYEITDRSRTSKEVGDLVGKGESTIRAWWNNWEENYGILESSGSGRGKTYTAK